MKYTIRTTGEASFERVYIVEADDPITALKKAKKGEYLQVDEQFQIDREEGFDPEGEDIDMDDEAGNGIIFNPDDDAEDE